MQRLSNHLQHHWRFYAAAVLGCVVFLFTATLSFAERFLAAGDSFFLVYLLATAAAIYRIDIEGLRRNAARDDEGIFIVILIALAVIGFSSYAIVTVLHDKHARAPLSLALALSGAPLGWMALHTIAAFHYANLYYRKRKKADQTPPLEFRDTKEPGIWEFLYYSFTIGMTAQTSDTNVSNTGMRRATLGHSVVSFFYNTAIIAMAVNAVVATAS